MHRAAPLLLLCILGLGGCKEKAELRELCGMNRVGERVFESRSLEKIVQTLKRAEEAEEIAEVLRKKMKEADARHKAELASNLEERKAAEAIPMEQKEERRKAIIEVTAKEQETQKLAEEVARYQMDIERNEQAASRSRKSAALLLEPLLKKHGMNVHECHILRGRGEGTVP